MEASLASVVFPDSFYYFIHSQSFKKCLKNSGDSALQIFMIIKPLSKRDTLCFGLFSHCYLGNKSAADGQIPQWTKVRIKVTQREQIPHLVKKVKYNSNRCFRLSQIVMELKILKKSRQAKISNIYSVLVHAALVLGEKCRSVHLPKRRQAEKAIQRYGQKHSTCPAN